MSTVSKCWSKLVYTLTNLVLIHIICYLSTVFQMLIRTCSHPPVIETEDMSESGQAEEPGKKVTYRDFMELWDTLFNSPRIKVRESIVYQHKVKWFWFFVGLLYSDLWWLWLLFKKNRKKYKSLWMDFYHNYLLHKTLMWLVITACTMHMYITCF